MGTTIRIGDIVNVASEAENTFWNEYDKTPRRWRVSSYLKPAVRKPATGPFDDILFEACKECGPDKCRLEWCSQEEAVYLSLVGVCGGIARVADCTVIDRVPWSAQLIQQEEEAAKRLIGRMIF